MRPYICKRKHGLTSNFRINPLGSRTCKDCERELAQLRFDPVKSAEKTRRWREKYPDRSKFSGRESVAKFRKNNPERARAIEKKYYESHKQQMLDKNIKRKRLLTSAVASFTQSQWNELILEFRGRCAYCGCSGAILERDHIIPLSKGGDHTKSNIVPACKPCNRKKGVNVWRPLEVAT